MKGWWPHRAGRCPPRCHGLPALQSPLDELARKLEKRSWARLIRDARSFATGFGSKAGGTGSRKMASYPLIVEAWNQGRCNNRKKIGG